MINKLIGLIPRVILYLFEFKVSIHLPESFYMYPVYFTDDVFSHISPEIKYNNDRLIMMPVKNLACVKVIF